MKEIKFRLRIGNKIVGYEEWIVPLGENGRWVYSYDNVTFNIGIPPIEHTEKDQYTGLKDKNGKEVFEGDVVKVDDRQIGAKEIYIGEVYYCTDYTLENNPCFAVWTKNGHNQMSPSIEIIGNIYENPELLKENK